MPPKEKGRQNGDPIPNVVLADNSENNAEPSLIIQREDGKWSIGWCDDAPGPFDSRADAVRVASGYRPAPIPAAAASKFARCAAMHPPDPETRKAALPGGQSQKSLPYSVDTTETAPELQARSLRRRFAFAHYLAVTVAQLAFAVSR
jgi:hypothetical protein